MRQLGMIALSLALTVFSAAPAFAQDGMDNGMDEMDRMGDGNLLPEAGDWEFTLSGAGSNNKEFDAGTANVVGDLGYYLTDDVAAIFRQSVGYSSGNNGEDWSANSRIALDYHFTFDDIRPFIGVNIGYIYGDAVDDTWAAGPEVGVKWYVRDGAFIFGRMEYQFFFDSADDVDKNFDDGNFIYALGIGLNF